MLAENLRSIIIQQFDYDSDKDIIIICKTFLLKF